MTTTIDLCPCCGFEAECEHGVYSPNRRPLHSWHCSNCGEIDARVLYYCQHCPGTFDLSPALDRDTAVVLRQAGAGVTTEMLAESGRS